ncbi:MAG: hypothetical protein H6R00_2790 [Proteobacteria bacterium]|nr:hypothetical protein [Pseudomonadota bacterium]
MPKRLTLVRFLPKRTILSDWEMLRGPLVIRGEVCYQARDLIGNRQRTRPKVVSTSIG